MLNQGSRYLGVDLTCGHRETVTISASFGLSNKSRRMLVLNAIQRIKQAIDSWQLVERDPTTTKEQREVAKRHIANLQIEFGGQWANIEILLAGQGDLPAAATIIP